MAPGDFVLLDSFIDRTTKRHQTFHGKVSGLKSNPAYLLLIHKILPPYCEVTYPACFFTPASIASLTCIDQRTILSLLLASMKEKLHPRLYFCIYLFTKTTILRRQNSYFF